MIGSSFVVEEGQGVTAIAEQSSSRHRGVQVVSRRSTVAYIHYNLLSCIVEIDKDKD